MNTPTAILSEKWVTAFGWTLLHSLWQGALVAILLGLTLLALKKHSAAIRYFATVTAMTTLIIMSVVTFLRYFPGETTSPPTSQVDVHKAPVLAPSTAVTPEVSSFTPFTLETFSGYFEKHFPLIVTLWLLGVLVLLLRFIGAFSYVQRLRNYKVTEAAGDWQQKVNAMSNRLGLSRAVILLESALVQVPMTIGSLKPVILMPLGALAGLAPAQPEAILAHELAHIRRHDYLVNMLQSLVEIVFFYHPAIWWLSARVREEREHCCDDMAIALSGDTVTFARALMQLEESYGQTPVMALAATGADGVLLSRIKRLLTHSKRTPTFTEGLMAAGILLSGAVLVSTSTFAQMNGNFSTMPEGNVSPSAALPDSDSPVTPETAQPGHNEQNAFLVQWADSASRRSDVIIVRDKKGRITELYIDGKRIPDNQIKNYQFRIDEALATQRDARQSDNPEREVEEALRRISQQDNSGNWYISGSLVMPEPPMPPEPSVPPVAPVPAVAPVPPVPPGYEWDEARLEVAIEEEVERAEREMEAAHEEIVEHIEELSQEIAEKHQRLQRLSRDSGKRSVSRKEMEEIEEELQELQREMEQVQRELNRKNGRMEHRRSEQIRNAQREQNRALTEVRRAQTFNQEKHAAWLREHEANMQVHAQQMEEHAARMKVHEVRLEKHGQLLEALEAQLVADGFMKQGEDFEFWLEGQTLKINGKEQSADIYQKYVKLLQAKGNEVFDKKPGDTDFKLHLQRSK